MLERVIENWLTRATEREFQRPFAYMLASQKYKVIHVTRHCGAELGKDVLAIDRDGRPCAFQLKSAPSGKISLRQWRSEISAQVHDLVTCSIEHPSIDPSRPHRSFLVTNGELEEEVSHAIQAFNRGWIANGLPQRRLETIVRGDLIRSACQLETDFWPDDLQDIRGLLELYLHDGRDRIPMERLGTALQRVYSLNEDADVAAAGTRRAPRLVSSAAVLVSLVLADFVRRENHVAQIEAWVMHIAYTVAAAVRWKINLDAISQELDLAQQFVFQSLHNLCEEIRSRDVLLEGDLLFDNPFQILDVRRTWLVALTGAYGLLRIQRGEQHTEIDEFIRRFVGQNKTRLFLWGEAVVPQFLATYWYQRAVDPTMVSDAMLIALLRQLAECNQPGSTSALASPYYEAEEVLRSLHDPDSKIEDSFDGASYTIEGVVHLCTRLMLRKHLETVWPSISRIGSVWFQPKGLWRFLMWRSEVGDNMTKVLPSRQSWAALQREAAESSGKGIPGFFKERPTLLLIFILAYPHRLTSSIVRFLDRTLPSFDQQCP